MPEMVSPSRASRFRWVICALIFFEITVNYVDRLVFGLVAPELQKMFHWSNADIPDIAFWFEVAYALGLAFVGRFLDRVGTRLGLALSLAGWCLASMFHAGMSTVLGFKFARFLLGLTESGAFPGAAKATAEWFPRSERALVAGVFNSGSNVGAIIAPLAVPWLFLNYGWQWAFIATGAAGLVWLVFWLALYRLPQEHPRVSPAELAHIHRDPPDEITGFMPWRRILATRQTWAFILGKFFTDAVWRWNLYLLPLFFSQHFHLDLKKFGPPFLLIYLMADVGSIGGGWLSSNLLKRGWSLNAARKTAMLACVLCVLPVVLVTHLDNMWLAIFLVGLATAAHQGWSSNLYTSISDMFPKHAVATVAGIGGTAGGLGAMSLLALTSRLFNSSAANGGTTQVYTVLFTIAGFAYLAALGSFHLCAPRLDPVRNKPGQTPFPPPFPS
jgi:ACS family hexuronate transporter-like MFS transporter